MARRLCTLAIAALVLLAACGIRGTATRAGTTLGQPADPALIERENIDVSPDGTGLPAGSGDAIHGKTLFAATCAQCHGPTIAIRPERWAYATSLFDYIRRAMPPTTRTKLKGNDVYALVAYLLASNSLISDRTIMNSASLPRVHMPRSKDFTPAR